MRSGSAGMKSTKHEYRRIEAKKTRVKPTITELWFVYCHEINLKMHMHTVKYVCLFDAFEVNQQCPGSKPPHNLPNRRLHWCCHPWSPPDKLVLFEIFPTRVPRASVHEILSDFLSTSDFRNKTYFFNTETYDSFHEKYTCLKVQRHLRNELLALFLGQILVTFYPGTIWRQQVHLILNLCPNIFF